MAPPRRSRVYDGRAEEHAATYRFEELGWLQFEQLCVELAAAELGIPRDAWHEGTAVIEHRVEPWPGLPEVGAQTGVVIAYLRAPAALDEVDLQSGTLVL